jgi:hypothetical protein
MRNRRFAGIAAAVVLALGGASGVAVAHGPGGHGHPGPRGEVARGMASGGARPVCTVPAADQLTTDTSRALKRLKARLDRRVAAGRITQTKADARLAAVTTRLSVRKLVAEARRQPLLDLLGLDADGIKAARAEGKSMRDLIDEKGITVEQLMTARKDGRTAARATRDELCPRPAATTPTA